MFVTIINDCKDPNAMGRQATRAMALLNCPVTTLGVQDQFEAAGCLVDTLDAAKNQPGWVLVNIAQRDRFTSKTNGPPFGYLECGRIRVIATLNTLSLMPTVGIKSCVVINMEELLTEMVECCEIDGNEKYRILHSQFRSFDFSIPLARWLSRTDYTLPEEHREEILPWWCVLA